MDSVPVMARTCSAVASPGSGSVPAGVVPGAGSAPANQRIIVNARHHPHAPMETPAAAPIA